MARKGTHPGRSRQRQACRLFASGCCNTFQPRHEGEIRTSNIKWEMQEAGDYSRHAKADCHGQRTASGSEKMDAKPGLTNTDTHRCKQRLSGSGRTNLAAGGAEGPTKATQEGPALAERRILRRLRPERPNHVWSYDFVQDRTHDGRRFRTLNIIDEFTKEALVILVKRRLNSTDVVDALTDLFILRGGPAFIRSDNVLCRELSAV